MLPPTYADVRAAAAVLADHLPPTPAWEYPTLDAASGLRLVVKHEQVQPTGAFKVRGGLTLLASMRRSERRRGIVGYSTGNHAQSLAYAAAAYDAPCVIVMPVGSNPGKAAAVRARGAELVEAGSCMDEAAVIAAGIPQERGMRLVSASDEPRLLAGVGTLYAELFAAAPDLDAVVIPVGGGSGASAAGIVAAALAPHCRVIGVQSAAAPAAYRSWVAGECVREPSRTRAEGLATGAGYALTQRVMRDHLSDFVLVGDDEIAAAQAILLTEAHVLAEGAGAASLAGALSLRDRLAGQKVGVVVTGGNASVPELQRVLAAATTVPA